MTAPLLAAYDLVLARGGATVLRIGELAVAKGEVLALIGPNGAGKSSLLLALAGLLPLAGGQLCLHGRPVARGELLPYRRRLAVVFQEPLLLNSSVADNVATGLKLRGVGGRERHERVVAALDRLGIAPLAGRAARTLSGGEAQRVSLARALAYEPELLFLDEPFGGLDPPTREELLTDLDRVLRGGGTTAILVTHDRSEAVRLADRLGVIIGGALRQLDTPDQVLARPRDAEVAAFVGMETLVPARVLAQVNGFLQVAAAGLTLQATGEARSGEPVLLGIRPEDVVLRQPAALSAPAADANLLPATVRHLVPAGPFLKVTLDCGFPLAAFATPQQARQLALAPGHSVLAGVAARAVHAMTAS
ncbi:MAG: ABC transporter ATP-binding protein [Thermodesulfobacteriota bacterium]